jgi:hypothetical protein
MSASFAATDTHDDNFSGGACSARPDGDRSIWSSIWKLKVPLEMRTIMAWKTATCALATNLGKVHRHIPTHSACPICGTERASSFHALITCMHAHMIWEGLQAIWPLPDDSLLLDSGKDWILQLLSKCSHQAKDLVIMTTIWHTWQLRNDITHGKSLNLVGNYNMEEIIKGKMPMYDDDRSTCVTIRPPKPWPPPPVGWVALLVDGSFSS